MSIIAFRQRHAAGTAGLPVVTPETEPMAARRRQAPTDPAGDAEDEQNWAVAVALASWPLCIGASAIYVVL
jgi:hypothetical protein